MWWHVSETEEGVRRQPVGVLLRKVLPMFRPYWGLLLGAFGLLFFITASQLVGPLVLRHIINTNIPAGDIEGLLTAAAIYVAIVVGGALVGFVQAITLFKLGINIITDIKNRLFDHVLRLGLDFHNDYSPGKLISRVESDTETLKEMFSDVAVNLLRNFLFFFGILVVMAVMDFYIAFWILLLVPVLFASAFWFINFMRKYWREWRARWAVLTGYVAEYIQGVDVIQQFNYEKRTRERMYETSHSKFRIEALSSFFDYGFWGVFMFGEIVALVLVLVVGVKGVFEGTVTIGTLVAFLQYIQMMFQPIMQLSEQLNFVQRSLISVERVLGILETEPSISDGPRPAGGLSFEREIRFENVWFAYKRVDRDDGGSATEPPEWEWVLKDVSFTIPKGETYALVGASGGGKSTIVNLLLRFYDPQQGRILVDGQDIREFPVKAWRERIGLVLQDVFLFPGSVADNLRVFDDSVPLEHVRKSAELTFASRIIEHLPDSYEGELAERGSNLSVGERQLISFARALVYDPPLLVLDEATSSVDPHTERLVQESLERLLEGRTAVIVAHRLSTILEANQILLIQDGRIQEQGSHTELLSIDGLYAKLFRLQFAGDVDNLPGAACALPESRSSAGRLEPEPGGGA